MKILAFARIIVVSLSFLITSKCVAQLNAADSNLYSASVDNALTVYHKILSPEVKLYDGVAYILYDYQISRGSPYFQGEKFSKGYIIYNNVLYKDIPLMYDIVRDKVVLSTADKIYAIELNSEKITEFGILGQRFVHVYKDSSENGSINSGFYNLLYNGNTRLLKKQIKNVQEDHNGSLIEKYILENTNYYIEKGAKYFSVNKKKSLLNALADKKKEIRLYMKKNKLKIGKDKDQSLVKILSYYDEITK